MLVKEQPEVLFVCVHNAGRSQMAAGLVKLRSQGRIQVRSAGSAPAEAINPAVLEAMQELGVDMSEEFPKPLTDEVVKAADGVITMGCGDARPIYPGKRYEDWELDDPAGADLDGVRHVEESRSPLDLEPFGEAEPFARTLTGMSRAPSQTLARKGARHAAAFGPSASAPVSVAGTPTPDEQRESGRRRSRTRFRGATGVSPSRCANLRGDYFGR